ncbi:MAG: transporter [Schleiferiaceae bacterium]|nr:transporter [Schleiferiaceae bacterium]
MKKHALIVFSLFLAGCTFGLQAQTFYTDRPDQTEGPRAVPKGSFQLESGILWEQRGAQAQESWALPNTLFRVGLNRWLELRLVPELRYTPTAGGAGDFRFSDLQVGAKATFLNREKIKIGLLEHLFVPTRLRQGESRALAMSHRLAVSHSGTGPWSLSYNLGYQHGALLGTDAFLYTLSAGYGLSEKLGLFIEGYGQAPRGGTARFSADAGLTYLLHPRLQLDYLFGFGLNHPMQFNSIGISWRTP